MQNEDHLGTAHVRMHQKYNDEKPGIDKPPCNPEY
jgi:hypothetical protein